MAKKKNIFAMGDVIRTNPQKGFYGIAVVLDCRDKTEEFLPMCHIAITPLIFQHEISMDEINLDSVKPLVFQRFYNLDKRYGHYEGHKLETCVHIFTNTNKPNLPIIGKINPEIVYNEPLFWAPKEDRYYFSGDVNRFLGREAYIAWCRENNFEIGKKE